jgi:co-chaperonin GroES (HSP10)
MQKLQPINNWLKILPDKQETKVWHGLILPDSVAKSLPENQQAKGIVIERGGGTPNNPMDEFKQNAKEVVRYPSGAGIPIYEENPRGEKVLYVLLKYEDILWQE